MFTINKHGAQFSQSSRQGFFLIFFFNCTCKDGIDETWLFLLGILKERMRWPWRSSVNWAAPDHTCWKREKTQVWTKFHPRWESIHWTLCSHSTYYTTVSAWKAVWRHANRAEPHAHQWSAFPGITCTKCECLRAGTLSETEVTAEDARKSCEKDFGVGGRFAHSLRNGVLMLVFVALWIHVVLFISFRAYGRPTKTYCHSKIEWTRPRFVLNQPFQGLTLNLRIY